MKVWVKRHPLSSYFFVACAVSWSMAVPLALLLVAIGWAGCLMIRKREIIVSTRSTSRRVA